MLALGRLEQAMPFASIKLGALQTSCLQVQWGDPVAGFLVAKGQTYSTVYCRRLLFLYVGLATWVVFSFNFRPCHCYQVEFACHRYRGKFESQHQALELELARKIFLQDEEGAVVKPIVEQPKASAACAFFQ